MNINNSEINILIVDDIAQNIQLLGNILRKEGYSVSYAQSGIKAIEMVEKTDFSLILLDIMMPEMDGIETCKKIKLIHTHSDIPILFLTARDDEESILQAFDAGGVDYIKKPFNSKELLIRVKTHLQIQLQKQALKEADASKNRFFSIISHDLRQPVSGISSMLKMLYDNFNTYENEKKLQFISLMLNSAVGAEKLLDQLLNWARLERGNISFNPENVVVKTIIDGIASLDSNALSKKKLKLKYRFEDKLSVVADINMLNTIFRNLISNAIKFSFPNTHIEIGATESENSVEFFVKDFGTGIEEKYVDKIFDNSSLHSTVGTDNEKGTGLGIILCKEFVKKHEGEIWYEPSIPSGATFWFTIKK